MWLGNAFSIPTAAVALLAVTATARVSRPENSLLARGECSTIVVVKDDTCEGLASKCHISPSDFTKYNPDPKTCSSLAAGQHVCCTAGTMPDFRPKQNSDGSCASYVIQKGDSCSSVAAANSLKVEDLSTFNDGSTWGWAGCGKDDFGFDLKICISKGSPPMPKSVDNAVCGPLKPGSTPPTNVTSLGDMNPCPLNACCNKYGQCGITPEFCTKETGKTGNPGTAPTGHNGCVSNCGTDIISSPVGQNSISIAYYESWNFDRDCVNMRASSISNSQYTHVHWAFLTITPDFDVFVNDTYHQWIGFNNLKGIKKIVSFGGWGYSTEPATYDKLRQAMNPGNVQKFTTNIVNFLNKWSLDGVDIDWEYPGAPDIPGIPPGLESDAPRYNTFLKILRGKMTQGKTISIAAPASYWYLKQFPIKDMVKSLDYVVYMTYDLHGQWDYHNKYGQEGCIDGNCLRSHVNMTETRYALAMITKAGVPSNKIAVGISGYGRSFGMTTPGCTGPMCTYGGKDSTATPGRCTGTAGYISNAEINEIIAIGDEGTKSWYDTNSQSHILTYGGNQWVAYLDDSDRQARSFYYFGKGFAGTIDWAVDLLYFRDDDGVPYEDDDDNGDQPGGYLPPCDAVINNLDDLNSTTNIHPTCTTIYALKGLSGSLNDAVNKYRDMLAHNYDAKFRTYAKAVSDSAGRSVHDFINKHGNDYFSCVVTEATLCCDACKGENGSGKGDPCAYCFDGKCTRTTIGKRDLPEIAANGSLELYARDHPHPVTTKIVKYSNQSEPCPPDYSKRGFGPDNPYDQSVYWTLHDDKADQFYADLYGETGIAKNRTEVGNYNRGNNCAPAAHMGDGDDCWGSGYDYNVPMPHGYRPEDVQDPKRIVSKALDHSDNIVQQVTNAVGDMQSHAFYGDSSALVDAISIPVLMIMNAVDEMSKVEEVADKIDEEKKKALILAFIGALLFFLPIAGEVLGTVAELADVGAILTAVSVAGDVALGVEQIVSDPHNPLLGILQIVLAPLALADVAQVTKAAQIRRGMKQEDIAKLGPKVAGRLDDIQKVIKSCRKK